MTPTKIRTVKKSATLLAATLLAAAGSQGATTPAVRDAAEQTEGQRLVPTANLQLDRSGQKKLGKGSFYANFFAGRKMANGEPFRLDTNNAASRTLPLGTTARVTNLDNGRSAVVVIKDRGPYVSGRIVDVSPSTAEQLEMVEEGVVPVTVEPLSLPAGGGQAKRGVDIADAADTR